MRTRCVAAICVSLLASGCVTRPNFDTASGVTPRSIIDVIQCEIVGARKEFKHLRSAHEDWVAVADLLLQVDEQATLTPAFTHTDIISKSLTRAFDWGIKFDTQAQRVYNESVTFKIASLKDPGPFCAQKDSRGVSLNGDLGLSEVLKMGFDSIEAQKDIGIDFNKDSKNNAFGTIVQFVVTKNVNGAGPTWTLVNFKGPGKLFLAQRSDTHKLTISFARKGNVDAARFNNTILFQQTFPSSVINQLQLK
jgi:hypothetical protein